MGVIKAKKHKNGRAGEEAAAGKSQKRKASAQRGDLIAATQGQGVGRTKAWEGGFAKRAKKGGGGGGWGTGTSVKVGGV